MQEVGIILLAYLIGSIPTAYFVARAIKKIDIRQYGSGNVGASNVWVHVGKWFALSQGSFDMLAKGSVPVYLAQQLGMGPWIVVATGLSAVVGHNWSIYLKFTGGRGVTVVLGVLLILAWKELVALVLVGLAGWLVFRSSGLWVGIGMVLIPAWSVGFGEHLSVTVLCVGLLAIVAAKRILSNRGGTERKLPWRSLLVQRLVHDRDLAKRDEWIYRTPTATQEDN
jgi:glycerol-3-phosphate acyltransferase PlsY